MRPARATHGDYGFAYRQKCQCEPCIVARRRYTKGLTYDHLRGVQRRVDSTPARDHIVGLMRAGASVNMITKAADGVVRSQIKRLVEGNPTTGKPVRWLYRHTAENLLAVTLEDCMEHLDFVHPAGTHRRMEAQIGRAHV
jgi:hypothetical protein